MQHNAHWLLITLAAVLLLGAPLAGCTARWSGDISIDVHYPGRPVPAAQETTG